MLPWPLPLPRESPSTIHPPVPQQEVPTLWGQLGLHAKLPRSITSHSILVPASTFVPLAPSPLLGTPTQHPSIFQTLRGPDLGPQVTGRRGCITSGEK